MIQSLCNLSLVLYFTTRMKISALQHELHCGQPEAVCTGQELKEIRGSVGSLSCSPSFFLSLYIFLFVFFYTKCAEYLMRPTVNIKIFNFKGTPLFFMILSFTVLGTFTIQTLSGSSQISQSIYLFENPKILKIWFKFFVWLVAFFTGTHSRNPIVVGL